MTRTAAPAPMSARGERAVHRRSASQPSHGAAKAGAEKGRVNAAHPRAAAARSHQRSAPGLSCARRAAYTNVMSSIAMVEWASRGADENTKYGETRSIGRANRGGPRAKKRSPSPQASATGQGPAPALTQE